LRGVGLGGFGGRFADRGHGELSGFHKGTGVLQNDGGRTGKARIGATQARNGQSFRLSVGARIDNTPAGPKATHFDAKRFAPCDL
jgi:hypothetical protein